ncbi:MAG TPA: hypothetical protein DET40_21685 [Lentisphaeria bacterium]|nr:MAG: hypothetical protein A2X45_10965 [Lentisphaerae bacterium GWF2_50_93]HCE46165.1 hypothetical protein [Lentisphaeria bacterium]
MFRKSTGTFGTVATDYYSRDYQRWIWHDATNYYMSLYVGQPISVDGGAARYPSGYLYDGYDYYVLGAGEGGYLWKDATNGWVITSAVGYGMIATVNWWKCSTVTGTFVKQGTASADKTLTNAQLQARYKTRASGITGAYNKVTGASSTLDAPAYFGLVRYDVSWTNGGAQTATITSDLAMAAGKYWFSSVDSKILWWDSTSSKYIISPVKYTKDALVGYWESPTTALAGTYTRVFTPAGDPPTVAPAPETYTLVFKDYIVGDLTSSDYYAWVLLWL